jgi:FkbM family methyltransferase
MEAAIMALPTVARSILTKTQYFLSRKSWFIYKSQSFAIEDRGLLLPVSGGVGMDMIGEGEHSLSDIIRWTYARRRGAFIDIGANVGRVLVHMARYDRSIPYIAFEPQLKAANHCASIIALNGLSATHSVLPIGLSDCPRSATFYTSSDTDVCGTINVAVRAEEQFTLRSHIALGRGDDYLADVPEIAFMKIDAEGAEVGVLKGLRRTLEKHLPIISFEVLPIHMSWEAHRTHLTEPRKKHAREIRDVLESHGYVIGTLHDSTFRPGANLEESRYDAYDFVAAHPTTLHAVSAKGEMASA